MLTITPTEPMVKEQIIRSDILMGFVGMYESKYTHCFTSENINVLEFVRQVKK